MCVDTNTTEAVILKNHRVSGSGPNTNVWDPCGVRVGSFQG